MALSRVLRSRVLNLEISCMAGGVIIGALDFLFFETDFSRTAVFQYISLNRQPFGMSFFAMGLVSVSVVCGLVGMILFLATIVIEKRKPVRAYDFIIPGSILITGCVVLAMRIVKNECGISSSLSFLVFVLVYILIHTYMSSNIREHRKFKIPHLLNIFSACMLIFALLFPSAKIIDSHQINRLDTVVSNRPSIVLIILDTLRSDHLSCYGYDKRTTPNIDRMSSESLLFLNAYSPAPWTLPTHASIFTGTYPVQHGVSWSNHVLDESAITLADELSDQGYDTVGITENPFTGTVFGLSQGFSDYYEMWRRPIVMRAFIKFARTFFGYRERFEYSQETVDLLGFWLATKRRDDAPFFAFINFMNTHLPNYPRPEWESVSASRERLAKIEPVNQVPERFYVPKFRLSEDELQTMKDIYDAEISYLDGQVGRLLALISAQGELDNTVVILTSDHGENFGDHGLIEHQFCVYDSLLHVPLIIRCPNVVPAGEIPYFVSTIHLFDTILGFAGNDFVGDNEHNDSLLKISQDSTVYSEYDSGLMMLKKVLGKSIDNVDLERFGREYRSISDGNYKFIWASNGVHEFFDIRSDPGETDNIIHIENERAAQYERRLAEWHDSSSRPISKKEDLIIDDETREALESLGYMK